MERVANWPLFTVEYSRYHYGLMEVTGNTMLWQAFDNNNVPLDMLPLQSRTPLLTMGNQAPGATTFKLTLSGKPGLRYVIEQSTNLSAWTSMKTNFLPANGSGNATNSFPSLNQQQFFRAVIR